MRSTTGAHFVALDHVRALAAFLVFSWHFMHGYEGDPVPFDGAPAVFPLALLDEGHTGVALFMTLSGFLFAKLLDGRRIDYWAFLRNRAVRLLPLLSLVMLAACALKIAAGARLIDCLFTIVVGLVGPTLWNGGWSITVEFHFYLLLPFLLILARERRFGVAAVIGAAILVRVAFLADRGDLQDIAYWTIFGRIDQFMLGILAAQLQSRIAGRHGLMLVLFLAFSAFWWAFDASGGLNESSEALWIVLPTIEGAFYAAAIAWYDGSFSFSRRGVSGFAAQLGEYSYSIYLLHFFFVFDLSRLIDAHVMSLQNIYVAAIWSFAAFLTMIVPGYLSFRFIESPFLRLRKPYILKDDVVANQHPAGRPAPAN